MFYPASHSITFQFPSSSISSWKKYAKFVSVKSVTIFLTCRAGEQEQRVQNNNNNNNNNNKLCQVNALAFCSARQKDWFQSYRIWRASTKIRKEIYCGKNEVRVVELMALGDVNPARDHTGRAAGQSCPTWMFGLKEYTCSRIKYR